MPAGCIRPVRGCAFDLVELECGEPKDGPDTRLIVENFVRLGFQPVYEEGEEILLKDAKGRICVDEEGCPQLRRFDISGEYCGLSPAQSAWFGGQRLVYDKTDPTIIKGAVWGQRTDCPPYFQMRAFQELARGRKICSPDGDEINLVHHFACVTDFRITNEIEIANGSVTNLQWEAKAVPNGGTYQTGAFGDWDDPWFDEEIYGYQCQTGGVPEQPADCVLSAYP